MKAPRIARAIAVAAVGALAVAGLSAVAAPAGAATRTLVRFVTSNAPTSINAGTQDTNLTVNNDISYLVSTGFQYYNNKPELVKNTKFGTFKVLKQSPFTVQYTINKGLTWSDGTPIDAADLMLTYVHASGQFNDDATKTLWDSASAGGVLSDASKTPKISADGQSLTLVYDKFNSSWELGLDVSSLPAHGLVRLAYPTDSPAVAKARFLQAVQEKDFKVLKKLADKWNTAYNILDTKGVDSSTNPNLLITSGAYKIKSAVANQSVTLVRNDKYKSGPIPTIKTIQVKVVEDSTAAAQALANGEIDLLEGQATADSVAALKKQAGTAVYGYGTAIYEHIDIKFNGPAWKGMPAAKAADLRKAFLLTVPREDIVNNLVKPVSSKAVVMNSFTTFPSEPGYAKIVANNGSKAYTGAIASRIAEAQKIMTKYGYSATNKLELKLLFGRPGNERREAEAKLMIASAAKAYIDLTGSANAKWSSALDAASHDVQFFAWAKTSTAVASPRETYGWNLDTDEALGGNYTAYKSVAASKALDKLTGKLDAAGVQDAYLAAEKELYKDAYGLLLFQHPGVAAATKALKNVKPGPLSPSIVWNYWEWKF